MLKIFKDTITKIISLFGFKVVGIKKTVRHNNFNSIHKYILNNFLKKKEITIFDVGANVGYSIDRFREHFSNCKIYSFEPEPEIYNILKKNHGKNEKNILINFALTKNDSQRIFNSYKYSDVSSFLEIKKDSKFEISRKLSSGENKKFHKKINVKCTTLDNYVKNNHIENIDILKIDTQGFESEVLDGAKNTLSENKISIIELEHIIGIAYDKNVNFYDIEKRLLPYDYKLIGISEGGNTLSYSSYQVDLIYVNREISNCIEEMHKKNINISDVTKKVNYNNPSSY